MESLPPDTKAAPLMFDPLPPTGRKRKQFALPKCFSSVALSLIIKRGCTGSYMSKQCVCHKGSV
jgi:hypothetical protein